QSRSCLSPCRSPVLFSLCCRHPPALHSFPTRRSSDLSRWRGGTGARSIPECPTTTSRPIADRVAPWTSTWLTRPGLRELATYLRDRKSTRLNSSHEWISYAVFCLKKKKQT